MKTLTKNFSISQSIALPLLALMGFLGLSLIKYDLIDHFGGINYKVVVLYNVLRLSIFSVFIYLVFFRTVFPAEQVVRQKTIDSYAAARKQFDPLLGLRAAAFFLVFLGHWFIVVFPPLDIAKPEGNIIIRTLLSASPWGGVWVFFTLSGYLMGKGFVTGRYSPDQQGISRFYRNRILRIVPLYFLSIFLITVLKKPEFIHFSNASQLDSFFSEILFESQGQGVIGALWSVSTEAQFYLAIPFIHIVLLKYMTSLARVFLIALIVVTSIIAIKVYSMMGWHFYWFRHVYFPVLANMDCFFAGYAASVLVNILRERSYYLKSGMRIAVCLCIFYYVILSYTSYITMAQESPYRLIYLGLCPGLTAIATATVIVFFEISTRSTTDGRFIRNIWALQSVLGLLTYSLYVWHEPVITSIRTVFKASITMKESLAYPTHRFSVMHDGFLDFLQFFRN